MSPEWVHQVDTTRSDVIIMSDMYGASESPCDHKTMSTIDSLTRYIILMIDCLMEFSEHMLKAKCEGIGRIRSKNRTTRIFWDMRVWIEYMDGW